MISRRGGLVLMAGLLSLLACVPASFGQAKKKGKPKVDYKVTIFDDEHFRGKNVIIRQSTPNLDAVKFSDHSESLKWTLPPGRAAILCDDKEFVRPVLVLVGQGEVEDLGKEQPNAVHSVTSVLFVSFKKGRYPQGVSRDVPRIGMEEE